MLKELFENLRISAYRTRQFSLSEARLDVLFKHAKANIYARQNRLLEQTLAHLRSPEQARRFAEDAVDRVPPTADLESGSHELYRPVWDDLKRQLNSNATIPSTLEPFAEDPKYRDSIAILDETKDALKPQTLSEHRAEFDKVVAEEVARYLEDVKKLRKAENSAEDETPPFESKIAKNRRELETASILGGEEEPDKVAAEIRQNLEKAGETQVALRKEAIDAVFRNRLKSLYAVFKTDIQGPVVKAFRDSQEPKELLNKLLTEDAFAAYQEFPPLYVNNSKNLQHKLLDSLSLVLRDDTTLGFQVTPSDEDGNFRYKANWTRPQPLETSEDSDSREKARDDDKDADEGASAGHVFADWLDIPEHRKLPDGFESPSGTHEEVQQQILLLYSSVLGLPNELATEAPESQAASQLVELTELPAFQMALQIIKRKKWTVAFCLSPDGFVVIRFDEVAESDTNMMRVASLLLLATLSRAMGCGKARTFPHKTNEIETTGAAAGGADTTNEAVPPLTIPSDAIWPVEIHPKWQRADWERPRAVLDLPLKMVAEAVADRTSGLKVAEMLPNAVGYDKIVATSVHHALVQRISVKVELFREGIIAAKDDERPQSNEKAYRRIARWARNSSVVLASLWLVAVLSTIRPFSFDAQNLVWKLSESELWLITCVFVMFSAWRLWVAYSFSSPPSDKERSWRKTSANWAFRKPRRLWFSPAVLFTLIVVAGFGDVVDAVMARLAPGNTWDGIAPGDRSEIGTFRYAIYAAMWTFPVLSIGALAQAWTLVQDVAARKTGVKEKMSVINKAEAMWAVGRSFVLRFLPQDELPHFDRQTSTFSKIGSVKQRLERTLAGLTSEDEEQSKRFAAFSASNATVVLLLGLLKPLGTLAPDPAALSVDAQTDNLTASLAHFQTSPMTRVADEDANCVLFRDVEAYLETRKGFSKVEQDLGAVLTNEMLVDCLSRTNAALMRTAKALEESVEQRATEIEWNLAQLHDKTQSNLASGVDTILKEVKARPTTEVLCGPPYAWPCELKDASPEFQILAGLRADLASATQELQNAVVELDRVGRTRSVGLVADTQDVVESVEDLKRYLTSFEQKTVDVDLRLQDEKFREDIEALHRELATIRDWIEGFPKDMEVTLHLDATRFNETQEQLHRTVAAFKTWTEQSYHKLYPFVPKGLEPLFDASTTIWHLDVDLSTKELPGTLLSKVLGDCTPLGTYRFDHDSYSLATGPGWEGGVSSVREDVVEHFDADKTFYVWATTDGTGSTSHNNRLAKNRAQSVLEEMKQWIPSDSPKELNVVPLSGGEFGWVAGAKRPTSLNDKDHRAASIYSC